MISEDYLARTVSLQTYMDSYQLIIATMVIIRTTHFKIARSRGVTIPQRKIVT